MLTVLFIGQSLVAQNGSLKGTLIDNNNNPIPFAHVEVLNSKIKTACDKNGLFALDNVDYPLVLRISAVGFLSMNKSINSSNDNLKISLKEEY